MTHGFDFRRLYTSAPCGLLITSLDGVITEVNATFLDWIGCTRDELLGTHFGDLLEAGSRLFYETRHMPVLYLEDAVREVSLSLKCADGRSLPVLINSVIERADVPIIHTAVFDATSRQEYERELLTSRRAAESSEARVRVLQQASSAFAQSRTEFEICEALLLGATEAFAATDTGVYLMGDDGRLFIAAGSNPLTGLMPPGSQQASMFALTEEKAITITASDDDSDFPHVVTALRAARLETATVIPLLRHGVALGVLACFYERRQDFDASFLALQAALARQAAQALVRVNLQQELERLALYDQLTGLANRRLIQDTVTSAIEKAQKDGRPVSVIFLDLDGFKAVNDQLGHAVGDAVLIETGVRIRTAVRHDDTVGRYGGDEFVAICEDADVADAAAIAERVTSHLRVAIEGIPSHLPVTASVGVATFQPGLTEPPTNDELLSLADSAMYLAKTAGKNRVATLRR